MSMRYIAKSINPLSTLRRTNVTDDRQSDRR